jgi:hypothetical protein
MRPVLLREVCTFEWQVGSGVALPGIPVGKQMTRADFREGCPFLLKKTDIWGEMLYSPE